MKKLMIVLILAFLYCSEHESQNRDDADKELEELRKKNFMLNGNEIKYNYYIYYIKYLPEEEPPQVRNYEQEIQKFLPFADEFRKSLFKKDPKEIIQYFSFERKRKIMTYLKESHCLSFGVNELTTEKLSELYGQEKLNLKDKVDYFYSGVVERKAPLIVSAFFYKWSKEDIYVIMIAPKWPHSTMDVVFFFKKNSSGKFEMDGYGSLGKLVALGRTYYDSPYAEASPDDKIHKLLPFKSICK